MELSEAEWQVMREEIFSPFEKANQIKIEPLRIEASDLPQILETRIAANKIDIDLFAADNTQLSYLVLKELVENLSLQEQDISGMVIPALIDAGRFKGKLYFMPYRPNVQITYYNANKFKQYRLLPPRDWNELLRVGKVLKNKAGAGKILLKAHGGEPTAIQLYEWIVSAGGDPLSINDPGCVKTFTFLQKLWPYCSADSVRAEDDTANEYLASDSAYLMQNWPSGARTIVDDFKKEGIKSYHGFSGPVKEAHVVVGEVLGIPKGAPNKKLAIKFIKYLQSREVQEKLASQLGWPSVRTDAYGTVPKRMRPYYNSISEALRYGVLIKNVYYWNDYVKFINEAFLEIVIRGEPVKRTLDFYRKQLDASKQRI